MTVNKHITTFVDSMAGTPDTDKLFILVCASELFRRTGQIAQQCGRPPADALQALSQFAEAASAAAPWDKIPFSLTHTLLVEGKKVAAQYNAPPDKVPGILLNALSMFLELLEQNGLDPDTPPEELLNALIAELSEQAQPPKAPVVTAPEIFQERMITRGFKPAVVTEKLARQLAMTPVLYKTDFGNGRLGPDIRGLCFENHTDTLRVILETGEYVETAKNSFTMATLFQPEDYAKIPATALAFVVSLREELEQRGILSATASELIRLGGLGEFTKPVYTVVADAHTVTPMMRMIDNAKEAITMGTGQATGPTGTVLRFPVADTTMSIILDARMAKTGPYVVARLVDGPDDKVLMRLDQPRHNSPRGAYLFPLADFTIALHILRYL